MLHGARLGIGADEGHRPDIQRHQPLRIPELPSALAPAADLRLLDDLRVHVDVLVPDGDSETYAVFRGVIHHPAEQSLVDEVFVQQLPVRQDLASVLLDPCVRPDNIQVLSAVIIVHIPAGRQNNNAALLPQRVQRPQRALRHFHRPVVQQCIVKIEADDLSVHSVLLCFEKRLQFPAALL